MGGILRRSLPPSVIDPATGKLVTSRLPDAVLGSVRFQAGWNASTNLPALPSPAPENKGFYWLVTTAGTISLPGRTGQIADWQIGDWIISDGQFWEKVDSSDQVLSVAGLQGVITAAALRANLGLAITDVAALQPALDAKQPLDITDYFPVRPSLDLRLTSADALPARFLTRTQKAYRTNTAGLLESTAAGRLRIDHDGSGNQRGAIFEGARTNQLLYTTDLAMGAWGIPAATTARGLTTAPDGTLSARVYRFAATANASVSQGTSLLANTTYTLSGWLKIVTGAPTAGTGGVMLAYYNNGAATAQIFAGSPAANYLTTSWQRFSVTFTNVTAGGGFSMVPAFDLGNCDVAIWGMQLEVGAYATSFIPTNTVAATRDPDVYAAPLGDWFNYAEGTFFLDFTLPPVIDGQHHMPLVLDDGTYNNRIVFNFNTAGSVRVAISVGNTPLVNLTPAIAPAPGTNVRLAMSYTGTTMALSVLGGDVVTGTYAGGVPPLTTLRLGSEALQTSGLNSFIRRVAYFPRALNNATLQKVSV